MKVLVQRTLEASVSVEESIISSIGKGLLLFVCLEVGDCEIELEKYASKVAALRIFEDDDFKMNKNIFDVQGEILSISQFTLSWDGKKGHRPSFDKSMKPNEAILKYKKFNQILRDKNLQVYEGAFGKDMKVNLVNDGPVTFILQDL